MMRDACGLPDGQRAETQVHAQIAGPAHGWELARVVVLPKASLGELCEHFLCAAGAAGNAQFMQVGSLEPALLKGRDMA